MKKLISTAFLTLTLLGGALLYGGLTSCTVREDKAGQVPKTLTRPGLGQTEAPVIEPGSTVIAYEMAWQKRDSDSAIRRLAGAVEVLLGEDAKGGSEDRKTLQAVVEGEEAGGWVRLANVPVLARYQPEYDEIRLIHEERDAVRDPGKDIGEDGAREIAEAYLKRLAAAGVVDPRLYAQATMQLGYKMVGEGSVEKPVEPGRVVEYRITFRPRLNGFEMVNAGLRLGILASGEVASLRLGGVTPVGEWQGDVLKPTSKDALRQVRVTTKELVDRFYRTALKNAEVQVAWSRIMYVMPEDKSEAVVEPRLVISYTELRRIDGELVTSRRKTLAYSLTDRDAAPVDFDSPAPRHMETTVTRQR